MKRNVLTKLLKLVIEIYILLGIKLLGIKFHSLGAAT